MRHGFLRAAAALVAALAFTGTAFARDINVAIDSAAALRLPEAAQGVAVGNPSIAGVSVQNDRLLFVTGRSYGATNLVVVGANGRTIYNGRIVVTPSDVGTVTMMRGSATVRLTCAAVCRPTPDVGDEVQTFSTITGQALGHAAAAQAGAQGD